MSDVEPLRKDMRITALLVALMTIVVGMVGIVSPDSGMTVRRLYFATPDRFYAAGVVRVAMGLVLILAASGSRWPRTLRALGAVICLQALAATLFGLERARAIMEWEAMQGTALLRAGAAVALANGGFIAFAVTKRPCEEQKKIAH
jgi:peptidoglycan/LPS O-acetylase OafA/YrhL